MSIRDDNRSEQGDAGGRDFWSYTAPSVEEQALDSGATYMDGTGVFPLNNSNVDPE